MSSEKDKMLAGELYDPLDPELVRARERARDLCQELNVTREADREARRRILTELLGAGGESVWMQPPFFCDYGFNILTFTDAAPPRASAPGRPASPSPPGPGSCRRRG